MRIYSLRLRKFDRVSSLRVIAPSPEAAHAAAIAALFCVRFEIVDTYDLGDIQP